jgi:hypothetical protein
MWKEVKSGNVPEGETLIGYSKEWIDEDFNPRGTRECFKIQGGEEWISAKWNDYHDCYDTDNTTRPELYYQIPALPGAENNYKVPAVLVLHSTPYSQQVYQQLLQLHNLEIIINSHFKSEAQLRLENDKSFEEIQIEMRQQYPSGPVENKCKKHSYQSVKKRSAFFNQRKKK